jgi:outer membrane lipoprotein-sorting protein
MRATAKMLIAFGLILALTLVGQAGEGAVAIIDKAIVAHGLKGKQDTSTGYRGKTKGTLHTAGLDIEFTQEVTVQVPDKFKEAMEMSVMGKNVNVTSVFNGKEGWIKVGDMDIKVENELLAEFKEAAYAMSLGQGLLLKDKAIKLGLLGEVMVKGKPALGIRVSKEGQRELSFFFDKETGLIAKVERRTRDFMSGQELTEERIITEYQTVAGRKIAKKVEVLRDGKNFLEAEVIEASFVEKLGDGEFAKP